MEKQKKNLIKKAKLKLFSLAFSGLLFVVIVGIFSFIAQDLIIREQSKVHQFYSIVTEQLTLVQRLTVVSDKISESARPEVLDEYKRELNDLIVKYEKSTDRLEAWINANDRPLAAVDRLLGDSSTKNQLREVVQQAQEMLERRDVTPFEIRDSAASVAKEAHENVAGLTDRILQRLIEKNEESLNSLKWIGSAIVAIVLVGLLFFWATFFRPLMKTIFKQHGDLENAMVQSESANRAKLEFLANVSHEIRTPMTAILGYAEIVKESSKNTEERNRAIHIIEQNANHLMKIIDEILDVSKVEAGEIVIRKTEVETPELMSDVFSLLHIKSKKKNIDLNFYFDGLVPRRIEADSLRVKQVLFNLIGNAIKFTDAGSVKVRVSLDKDSKDVEMLRFTVTDTGCGIDENTQRRLFQPFVQAETSISRQYGGTGLGLALSKRLAQSMGGDITLLNSGLGYGSTFCFQLPVGNYDSTDLVSSFHPGSAQSPSTQINDLRGVLKGFKILVVDDAMENCNLFKIYLERAQADVDVAFNGEEGLSKAISNYYDLILMDLQMPEKDGFQVLQELRAQKPSSVVVALTAHGMAEEKEKTAKAGFNGHIVKPVSAVNLIVSIIKIVGFPLKSVVQEKEDNESPADQMAT